MQSASAGQIIFSADAWAILDAFRKSLANDEATDIQGYFDALAASSSIAVDSLASAAKTDLGLT